MGVSHDLYKRIKIRFGIARLDDQPGDSINFYNIASIGSVGAGLGAGEPSLLESSCGASLTLNKTIGYAAIGCFLYSFLWL